MGIYSAFGFKPFDTAKFFGFIKEDKEPKDISRIMERRRYQGGKVGSWVYGRFHCKELKQKEMKEVKCTRFLNNLLLDRFGNQGYRTIVPKPFALVYTGKGSDFIGENSNGYILNERIFGENFDLEETNFNELERILMRINLNLSFLRERGIYLMDFAPRDIIIRSDNYPVFVDMEHVEYNQKWSAGNYDEELRGLQAKQFEEDYQGKIPAELYYKIYKKLIG